MVKRAVKDKCKGKTDWDFEKLCRFLVELDVWLKWFHADYTKVRIALCNVERRAWGEGGTTAKRFCKNGPGDDPPPPPKPPTWG
jgi:hypothetical protein